jgi:TPR repeat protein
MMLQAGVGTPMDLKAAANWYETAAMLGHLQSQVNLGIVYVTGQDRLQDFERAHMWFNIAAATGHETAASYRDRLAAKMNKQSLAAAQKKARICVENALKDC